MRQALHFSALWVAASVLCLAAPNALADSVSDFSIYQPFVSARALGMGNAFTAVADDYSAMFYNPGGLARRTDSETNLEIRGMVDSGALNLESQIAGASGGAGSSTSVAQINNILTSDYGKHYSARLPTIGAYYVRPHWGIAFIPADLSVEMGVHQLVGPALGVVATQDSTLAFSLATDLPGFGKDEFSVGATFKGIYRGYYNESFLALDLATNGNLLRAEDAKEGLTVDADVGAMYTPHIRKHTFMSRFQPTFAVAVRNVVDEGFFTNYHLISARTTGAPPKLQRRFDAGATFQLPDWWVFKSRVAFDIRDVGYSEWTFKKGTHAGVEFLWKVRSWFQGGWRAGLNQGFWTAGFTGRFAIFQLDLVSYGEDVGPQNAPLEDRRYMLKCSLDW